MERSDERLRSLRSTQTGWRDSISPCWPPREREAGQRAGRGSTSFINKLQLTKVYSQGRGCRPRAPRSIPGSQKGHSNARGSWGGRAPPALCPVRGTVRVPLLHPSTNPPLPPRVCCAQHGALLVEGPCSQRALQRVVVVFEALQLQEVFGTFALLAGRQVGDLDGGGVGYFRGQSEVLGC